jgi:hypothetical protein
MTSRALLVAIAVGVAIVSTARGARAADPANLVYARGAGAESCPDESALRKAVAARMGHDPFWPVATTTIRVVVSADGGRLRGLIVVEKAGVEKGSQTIDEAGRKGAGPSCEELLASIALAVSVALDADSAPQHTAPEPAPEEPAAPAKVPMPPAIPPEASPEAKPEAPSPVAAPPPVATSPAAGGRRLALWVAPDLRASIGYWPVVAFAPDVFAELRYGWIGLGVEGRIDVPATVDVGTNDTAKVERFSGSVLPCAHLAWFGACGLATFGATRASGAVAQSGPYVAFGGRVGVDVPLSPRFHLLGTVDVTGSVTPLHLSSNGTLGSGTSSSSGNPEGSLGIALLVSIF